VVVTQGGVTFLTSQCSAEVYTIKACIMKNTSSCYKNGNIYIFSDCQALPEARESCRSGTVLDSKNLSTCWPNKVTEMSVVGLDYACGISGGTVRLGV
jgi:hypothetical protein